MVEIDKSEFGAKFFEIQVSSVHQNGRKNNIRVARGSKRCQKGQNGGTDWEARGSSMYVICMGEWICVQGSTGCCNTCNWYTQQPCGARGVALHTTTACGPPCVHCVSSRMRAGSCGLNMVDRVS
ncbi:hypothetical protein IGI04_036547 [Brassica rapa subsp. trilocularis]|uniref:Uncharacterized protein n=1 Tax=Brassica rapa subsp. trilocularis TaxID=1813537 RepID=A0ABQ7LFR9_BRACM|nr:hypothetical protein IGI04_036547 [Brassica rapa subsp. trilocularis]